MLFEAHESRPGGMSGQQVLLASGPKANVVVMSSGYEAVMRDFAFLLPVPVEPTLVRDGDPLLFPALQELTAPRVRIVDNTARPTSSGGCACGGGAMGAMPGAGGGEKSVQVYQRGETATFDYVVVGGSDGSSLAEWLNREGFSVPASFQAALDVYLEQGNLYLAAKVKDARLQGELAPLELHFPPAPLSALTYPFGLTGSSLVPGKRLGLTLYVASTEAYLPKNYPTAKIENSDLVALSPYESSYERVFEEKTRDGALVIDFAAPHFGVNDIAVAKQQLPHELRARHDRENAAPEASSAGGSQGFATPPDAGTPESAGEPGYQPFEKTLADALGEAPVLVRLRGELTSDQLRDMTFETAPQDNFAHRSNFTVVYQDPEAEEARRRRHVGTLGFSVLPLMLFGWRRRRSQ